MSSLILNETIANPTEQRLTTTIEIDINDAKKKTFDLKRYRNNENYSKQNINSTEQKKKKIKKEKGDRNQIIRL